MEELYELMESLDFENYSYFYHVTGSGFGDEIIESGLSMEEKELRTTMLSIPLEMTNDPVSFCENEYTNGLTKRQEMVIIVCEKGYETDMAVENDDPRWIGDQQLKYIVLPEHILGYIDLSNLNVVYNPECLYHDRRVK